MATEYVADASRSTRSEADVRRARRYDHLANEMEAVFENWLMPIREQFVLSNYIADLRIKAAHLRKVS